MKILALSGWVPEQICDTVRYVQTVARREISHYCPYASKFIEQVCTDASIDGAVFPRSCDSSRVIESYLEDCGKFVYQVYVPARQDETAVQFLSDEIQRYQRAVEQWYEIVIDDVAERTELVNKRNQQLHGLYSNLPEISFTDWIRMLHRLLQQPLREQSVSMEHIGSCGEIGKRVFLMGSTLICEDVAKAIEQVGLTVVGDNLPESGRLVSSVEVSTSGNLYENIARGMLQGRLSPTQSAFSSLLEENAIALKHSQAQGVIYITQKYCEPYDYLFPVYKRMADDLGIPVLRLVLNGDGFESAADTTLEAFAEML